MAAAVFASALGVFTGTPANNDTATVGSVTYRFRTIVGGGLQQANDVLIQGSSSINLAAAINADPTLLGIGYATGTVQNPEARAYRVANSTQLTVKANVPGIIGNRIPLTKSAANFLWSAGTLQNGAGDLSADLARYIREYQCPAAVEELFRYLAFNTEQSP